MKASSSRRYEQLGREPYAPPQPRSLPPATPNGEPAGRRRRRAGP